MSNNVSSEISARIGSHAATGGLKPLRIISPPHYMFLEMPAGDSALCHPHGGPRLKEAPSPTSITGSMTKRAVSTKPPAPAPAPGMTHDTSILFHFPPACHMVAFVSFEGQRSTVLTCTRKMEVGSSWWKALVPTMDGFLDKYQE